MKKGVIAGLSLTLALVSVAGCGAKSEGTAPSAAAPQSTGVAASGQKKLSGSAEIGSLLAEGTSGQKFMIDIGDQISKENPGAKYQFTFAGTKARPMMEQRWRANNPPDVDYFVFNGQVPKTYEFADKLVDFTPYLNETLPGQNTKWIDSFMPSVLPQMKYQDEILGIPTDQNLIVLFYNKKMFDDLKLSPPKTWDEFISVGQELKKHNIDPVAVTGTFTPYMELWSDYLFMREAGYGESVKAIRGAGFKDNPAFLSAAKKLQDMRDQGFLMKGFQGTDFTAAEMNFFQGKSGMILVGTWLLSEMRDSIPKDFKTGVTPFPAVTGGKGDQTASVGAANLMVVPKSSKNLDLALEYIKQFTSRDAQTKRAAQFSLISPVKGIPVSDEMQGLKDIVEKGGVMNMRYLGLEFESDLWNAYALEVSKLFFGKYTAEQFIDAIDAVAKKYKK